MPNVTPLLADDPRRVGRYRLTGRVDDFAGEDVFLAQRVDGLTVLAAFPGAVGDAAATDRFVAEARAARNVPPYCVARILDAGVEGEQPYLITQFVDGPTLTEVIHTGGPLPAALLRPLVTGCATGIASIHQAGLVHGRFGPDQVVLGTDGPRVVHFSTTPPYGTATPAADILAWARVVTFAATGHARPRVADLDALPDDLRPAVADCFSPEPLARPNARALLTVLLTGADVSGGLLAAGARRSQAVARAPAPVPPAPADQRPARRGRSGPVLWAAAFAACVVAIAAAVFFIAGRPSPKVPAPQPDRSLPRVDLPIPRRVSGIWSGTIHQTNPSLSVSVRLALPGGRRHGTLAYPQIGCTGRLALATTTGSVLTFRLAITSGQSNCVGGVVLLAPHGNTMTFTFLRPGGDNPTGTLARGHGTS